MSEANQGTQKAVGRNRQGQLSYTENVQQVDFVPLPDLRGDEILLNGIQYLETHTLLNHPLFYSPLQQIDYIDDIKEELAKCHDELTSVDEQKQKSAEEKLQRFQRYLHIVTNKNDSWKQRVPADVNLIRGWNNYPENELYQLVRLTRNFPTHFKEIKSKAQSISNAIGSSKEDSHFYMLNSFPNLIPVLKLFQNTEQGILGLDDRHADVRWLLLELFLRARVLEKQEGQLLASYVRKEEYGARLSFIRHRQKLPNKYTTVVCLNSNRAQISVLSDPNKRETVHSFDWNVQEWKAIRHVIVITNDITEAVQIHKKYLPLNATVILGVDKATLSNVQNEFESQDLYDYVPTSWTDLGNVLKQELMMRNVLVSGKPKSLEWLGTQTDSIFKELNGVELLKLLDNQTIEMMDLQKSFFKEPKIYVPLDSYDSSGQTCLVTGSPYSGKSVSIHREANSDNRLTIILKTHDFLHWYYSERNEGIARSVARFLCSHHFGQEMIHAFLTRSDKKVQIVFDDFQEILDEEFGNLDVNGYTLDSNDGILQECSNIIEDLKQLPEICVTVATRSQCVLHLQQNFVAEVRQRKMTASEVKYMLTKLTNLNFTPEWLDTILCDDTIDFEITPMFCQTISSMQEYDDDLGNEVESEFYCVQMCNACCNGLFMKKMEATNITKQKAIKDANNQMKISHVYIACKAAFPSVDLKFMETSFMFALQISPTISSLDFGLLKFENYNFDASKSPEEQGISFIDKNFATYWIAYGVIFLSCKYKEYFEVKWGNFLKDCIFTENNVLILKYIKAMLMSEDLFSETEKKVCRSFIQPYCIHANPEIDVLLKGLLTDL